MGTRERQGASRGGGCSLTEGQEISGSQRWLQVAVNRCPEVFDRPIAGAVGLAPNEALEWVSPLEDDGFRECRDQEFLLGPPLSQSHRSLSIRIPMMCPPTAPMTSPQRVAPAYMYAWSM